MITVRIHVTADKGKRQELTQTISLLEEKINQEPGCASCQVYQRTESEDEFVIIEEWESEETAQAHLESENLTVLAGAASVLSREVRVALGRDPSSRRLKETFTRRILKRPQPA